MNGVNQSTGREHTNVSNLIIIRQFFLPCLLFLVHHVPSDQSESNTIDHHIYERRNPKQHHETNSATSLYRTAQIQPVTAITAGIVLVLSYCSYRIFLR